MPPAGRISHDPDTRLPQRVALGVLLRSFPPVLVDRVLDAAGRREQRQRLLPARLMVYFTLGMWIFKALPYEQILAELLRDAPGLAPPVAVTDQASAAAIGRARRRLGVEPLRLLFEEAARQSAADAEPFHGLRPLRVCELDVGVPATPANLLGFAGVGHAALARVPGLPTVRPARVAPRARTRLLLDRDSRRIAAAEVAVTPAPAPDRLPPGAVQPGDLLVMDERPLFARLWTSAESRGAQLLWPLPEQVQACGGSRLPDGSVLGKIQAEDGSELVARVLASVRHPVRLATSILDHRAAPADELAALYDAPGAAGTGSVFDGIGAPGGAERLELRSKDPEMVRQELYAMLCVHHAIGDLVGPSPLAPPAPAGSDSRPSKVSKANSWPPNFACAQIRITHSPESGGPVDITVPPHGQ